MNITIKSIDYDDILKLKVNPKDKVIDIKKLISQSFRFGLLIKEQKLIFNDHELEDDKNLEYYSISNGSTLNVIKNNLNPYLIFIKPPIGRGIEIEVTCNDKIKDIKDEIYKIRGIPQSQQQISYNDKILSDNTKVHGTIGSYQKAFLITPFQATKKIYVRAPQANPIEISFGEDNTIGEIKGELIEKKYNLSAFTVPDDKVLLSFCGVPLDDSKKIDDYLIPEKSILDFLEFNKSGIVVFFKDGPNKFYPFEIHPNDTISEIKNQLEEQYNIQIKSKQLFYNYEQLLDEKQIQFYRIYSFDTIEIKSQIKKSIQIFYKIPSNNERHSIQVDTSIKVKDLKMMIESQIGVKSSDQRILFQLKQLEDNLTIKQCSISENSTLLVVPIERKQMKITVSIPNKEPLVIHTIPTIFVNELKMKIEELSGIPKETQQLTSNKTLKQQDFTFLKDDESLLVYSNSDEFYVDLHILERGGFFIFIKISFDNYIPIEVKPSDNFSYVKEEVQKRAGIPIDQLKIMDDETKSISNYSLSQGDVLYCSRYKERATLIYVKTLAGRHAIFYVNLEERIIDLKKLIKEMKGMPVKEQRLIFAGRQLEDENTLESYSICQYSTLHLVLRLRG